MFHEKTIHHGINISLHVLILFIFLTCFFFMFVSKIEQDTIQKEIDGQIKKNIPQLLENVWEQTNKYNIKIKWSEIGNLNQKIKIKYKYGDLGRLVHNKKLLNICIIIIIVIIVFIIITIVYFSQYKKMNLQLKSILIDNLIIFIFVGIIEYLFFTKVAFKYLPVKSSDLLKTLLSRIKYHINNELS